MDPMSTFAAAKLGLRVVRELRAKFNRSGPRDDSGRQASPGDVYEDLEVDSTNDLAVPCLSNEVRGFQILKDSDSARTWTWVEKTPTHVVLQQSGGAGGGTVTVWLI